MRYKRLLSLMIVVSILFSTIPGLFSNVLAATVPISISIDRYSEGNLKVSWNASIQGVDEVNLIYHVPDNLDPTKANFESVQIPIGTNSYEITGLKNDYVYDIELQMNINGVIVGRGLLYFTPGITFSASPVKENVVDAAPDYDPPYSSTGGREIGTKPKLRLKWSIPKVYNGSFFANVQSSLGFMQSQLNGIYDENRILTALNYRINISSKASDMSLDDAVIIDGITNRAYVVGRESDTAIVNEDSDSMTIDLLGRASETDELPVTSSGTLGHSQIMPGTVYYMNIQPVIVDYADAMVINGGASALAGKPYTYTYIRFQMSKDDSDNVYTKVYTVNQGSLQLPDLYYEVQMNTVDSEYGWVTKASIDPDYFKDSNGNYLEYGIIPIIGISANNNLYYRIVASSSSNDSLRSQNLPYKMSQDSSMAPIPKNISIDGRVLVTNGNKKSTDVTISWDKPSSWDEIKANIDSSNDLYFCIMLNISQTEITDPPYPILKDGDETYEFPAKYRLVRYINAKSYWDGTGTKPEGDVITENGNRLEYTLTGFDLFNWTDEDGNLEDFPATLPESLKPESGYPDYLLPNTVYYMQMYTTKGLPGSSSSVSDRSVTVSFTTLAGLEKDVPMPSNFMVVDNTAEVEKDPLDSSKDKVTNTVILQFDTINTINWADYDSTPSTTSDNKIYYDLYMSTNSVFSTETLIGSTDDSAIKYSDDEPIYSEENNVKFEFGVGAHNYIKATISTFPNGKANTSFGNMLNPNTTYYFRLQARLVMPDSSTVVKKSKMTSLLPVTTKKGEITLPDDSERTPVAPTDFAIAKDAAGNLMVSGSSVTFQWERKETDVIYTLVCTSSRVDMDDNGTAFSNDAIYQDFKKNFGYIGLGIRLDPDPDPMLAAENFSYDPKTNICTYTVDKGLFPNRLYYFSLRAEKKQDDGEGKTSVWISIPVTTSMIEAPTGLQAINDPQLGFFWLEADSTILPEDYNIYIKGPSDTAYKLLSRSQMTIVKDSKIIEKNGELCYIYYCRVFNLKNNTTYSIAVYKGENDETLVYSNASLYTKDGYHQVMAKWKGIEGYNYEVAIKTADEQNYTTLSASDDFEIYSDVNGTSNPYYLEETNQTKSTGYVYYYVKINSIKTTLSDGRVVHNPLKSNTKYQIKVRAYKADTIETAAVAYSKYIGPVETRTEYSQDDYDNNENNENNETSFLDKIKSLEERIFWRMAISNSSANKILLKGDRIVNTIQSSGSFPVTVDLSTFTTTTNTDTVYIPSSIVKALNSKNKSLTIKTPLVQFVLGPRTFDLESGNEIAKVGSISGVKDTFFKLTSVRSDYPQSGYPSGMSKISKVDDFSMNVLGANITDTDLEKSIYNELYNSNTGLVKEKLKVLSGTYGSSISEDEDKFEAFMGEIFSDLEVELSSYINKKVEGSNGTNGMILVSEAIKSFYSPMMVKLAYNSKAAYKLPYAMYSGKSTWQRISKNVIDSNSIMSFYVGGTGKIAILASASTSGDVPSDYWASGSIGKLTSKFDLSDVFSGIGQSFSPEATVSVKEAILLYEKVMGMTDEDVGMDAKQKAVKLGINDILSTSTVMKSLTKQQLAALVTRIYAQKSGMDEKKIVSGHNIAIIDEKSIDDKYYSYVLDVLDMEIMTLDENGSFNPQASVTRALITDAVVKALQLAGVSI